MTPSRDRAGQAVIASSPPEAGDEAISMPKQYKLVVYVPVDEADKIRQVLGEAGAGQVGNYDFASFSVRGVGRFRPLAGARPAIGKVGKFEEVEEERIETVVGEEDLGWVLEKLRDTHPYEVPVIDVYELKNKNASEDCL